MGFDLQRLPGVGGGDGTMGTTDRPDRGLDGGVHDGGVRDAATVQPDPGGLWPVTGGMVTAGPSDSGTAPDASTAPDAALGDCDPATYVSDGSCGVGICRARNQPSSCQDGVELACMPAAALSPDDATCDGVDDNCNGTPDEDFTPRVTVCGMGACASSGTVSCQSGGEVDSCVAGSPLSSGDSTCDDVDDDCDGRIDEDFSQSVTRCGQGVCATVGVRACQSGGVVDTCVPLPPNSTFDDASGVGNGLDDDCDGQVDEDLACDTSERSFGPGSHNGLAVPANCSRVRVRLWGAGGTGGAGSTGGDGGSGGYAESILTIGGSIDLWVGGAGSNCTAAGSNAGSANFAGGAGGAVNSDGSSGGDGAVSGGGSGGSPTNAGHGGLGYYGGGGGGGTGGSDALLTVGVAGGGAGAATVMLMNGGVGVGVVAGGGGGGGGGSTALAGLVEFAGGSGGGGCGGSGGVAASAGGGGGTCVGDSVQASSTRTPPSSGSIPNGYAVGGGGTCGSGGDGYAIVNFLQ